jgi:hypothetical protein
MRVWIVRLWHDTRADIFVPLPKAIDHRSKVSMVSACGNERKPNPV